MERDVIDRVRLAGRRAAHRIAGRPGRFSRRQAAQRAGTRCCWTSCRRASPAAVRARKSAGRRTSTTGQCAECALGRYGCFGTNMIKHIVVGQAARRVGRWCTCALLATVLTQLLPGKRCSRSNEDWFLALALRCCAALLAVVPASAGRRGRACRPRWRGAFAHEARQALPRGDRSAASTRTGDRHCSAAGEAILVQGPAPERLNLRFVLGRCPACGTHERRRIAPLAGARRPRTAHGTEQHGAGHDPDRLSRRGKTTLLNRILKEQHGKRIAVIENEFGEAGVDNEILVQDGDEQIVEMNNGCICCTVRGDLIRILGNLKDRRDAGALRFDRVIIETTGMADPGPVAQTFFMDEDDRRLLPARRRSSRWWTPSTRPRQLDEFHEAQEQVGFADRILLSKTDLVSEEEAEHLSQRLRHMNPRAPIKKVHFGEMPIDGDPRHPRLQPERDPRDRPGVPRRGRSTSTTTRSSSFVFRSERPFDGEKLEQFLVRHDPGLRPGHAALQGRAVDEGQRAPRSCSRACT